VSSTANNAPCAPHVTQLTATKHLLCPSDSIAVYLHRPKASAYLYTKVLRSDPTQHRWFPLRHEMCIRDSSMGGRTGGRVKKGARRRSLHTYSRVLIEVSKGSE
jgi:hypothetical protein